MGDRAALGRFGEQLAATYLQRRGLTIISRNWRCSHGEVRGELDLVARDGPVLVFCEVKTRTDAASGGPLAAVDPRKQRRLRQLASAYLDQTGVRAREVRFDVVGITFHRAAGPPRITHVRGVAR